MDKLVRRVRFYLDVIGTVIGCSIGVAIVYGMVQLWKQ